MMEHYFSEINKQVAFSYEVANKARKKNFDPEPLVSIPLAKNLAERAVGLVSVVAPSILNKGIPQRITELERKYGSQDWRIALVIAEEIAQQKFCSFPTKLEAMEAGMRVGFAYITMGTVSSPLEGFIKFQPRKRGDGMEYLAVFYSGPIRSAGGTGASVSVLIADYLRKKMGYAPYDPTDSEVKRTLTEVRDYHDRITNLQYLPSEAELTFMLTHLPLQIDGDPSEDLEVSNYKDLPRVETNRLRNGVCLVSCECLSQKAPKLWAQISKWGKDFDLDHWSFLKEFLDIQHTFKSKKKVSTDKLSPIFTYISDLVAGRPVLAHPMRSGGFRLRYGRCRTSGFSAAAIHPATSVVLNEYIAIGTQLKVERPGKAASLTFCDSIEGPLVRLSSGSVMRIETVAEARRIKDKIVEILYLGDILFNYGDFFNRAHPLLPPGYCEEYWAQEGEREIVNLFGTIDLDKLSEVSEVAVETLSTIFKNPLIFKPRASAVVSLSQKTKIPLHPRYTYHWKEISPDQLSILVSWASLGKVLEEEGAITKIVLPFISEHKRMLDLLGVPHSVTNEEFVVIEKDDALAFGQCLHLNHPEKTLQTISEHKELSILDLVALISGMVIRDKSGLFVGARMGRPEKAKMRKLTGSPHVLFPVGAEGGKMRSFQSALQAGKITAEFSTYRCPQCDHITVFKTCETCDKPTKKVYYCQACGPVDNELCNKHGPAAHYALKEIEIQKYFDIFTKKLNLKAYPDLIKGVKGTSNKEHIPEHLVKGILRAQHNICVNKDGTIRYDMTQLPLTHFKPMEINTPITTLHTLGYATDIYGAPLSAEDQVCELKPQDVVLPACLESPDEGADKILFRTTKFLDDLLTKLYGMKPFYNLEAPKDIVGHLGVVLAPHTSAGIIARIIGFSQTQGFFAHPMLHAATRRDCDGDEASITLLLDALLNFSRQFLPATRGATQDAPLVLTSTLTPAEVDDMAFDLDVVWQYPLEFYKACSEYKMPHEVQIEQLSHRLGTDKQYFDFGYTHTTTDINEGTRCSAYKTIPSMEEKMQGQMELADKIRAVDAIDVARLVIQKHFLPDIKGNLRKFSMQQFRCVNCNEKYRRVPLVGKCTKCGGKLLFTISEGSIIKYLEPAIQIAEKYHLPAYLKQTLEITKKHVEGVFGKEREKQVGLAGWVV